MNIIVKNNESRLYFVLLKTRNFNHYCVARVCCYKFNEVHNIFVERTYFYNDVSCVLDSFTIIKMIGVIDNDCIKIIDKKYGDMDILYVSDKRITKDILVNNVIEEFL